jgi:CheY-like chemotaxis protein
MPVSKRSCHSILCIGNDPVHLNLRCSLLKEHGWNVLSSGSGHEGVIRFSRETVDAVVVDLNHDGTEAALITGELKRLRPEVPVIILVADTEALANGATQQANAVVVKSQEARLLVDTLRKMLPGK